jgi:hypothetical protein
MKLQKVRAWTVFRIPNWRAYVSGHGCHFATGRPQAKGSEDRAGSSQAFGIHDLVSQAAGTSSKPYL